MFHEGHMLSSSQLCLRQLDNLLSCPKISPQQATHIENSQHYPGTFFIQQSLNKSSINQSTDEVRHEGDFHMPLLPLNFDTNTN